MPSGAQKRALIAQLAKQHGLDPHAVLAVASVEGGFNGAVGDQGTSFGPFQLHWGGAMPSQFRGNSKASQKWANSAAGITYAIRQMASHAKGLQGRAAVNAIVTKFERPAAPGAEVEKAFGRYGTLKFGGGSAAAPAPSAQGTATQLAGQSLQSALASQLLAQAARTSQGQLGDSSGLMAMAQMRQQLQAAQDTYGPMQQNTELRAPLSGGKVLFAKGSDRAGAHTGQGILSFAQQVAGVYGKPLTITTGTQHNQFVKGTRRESAHWQGNAVDIAASGAELTRQGQSALIAAGMPAKQARKIKGGLFNINGRQVIFNTNEGGNHFNHLHIGLRGGG